MEILGQILIVVIIIFEFFGGVLIVIKLSSQWELLKNFFE